MGRLIDLIQRISWIWIPLASTAVAIVLYIVGYSINWKIHQVQAEAAYNAWIKTSQSKQCKNISDECTSKFKNTPISEENPYPILICKTKKEGQQGIKCLSDIQSNQLFDDFLQDLEIDMKDIVAGAAWFTLLLAAMKIGAREEHKGWQRVSIVGGAFTGLLALGMYVDEWNEVPQRVLLIAVTGGLIGFTTISTLRRLYLWVHDGFQMDVLPTNEKQEHDAENAKTVVSPVDYQIENSPAESKKIAQTNNEELPIPVIAGYWQRVGARCIDIPIVFVGAELLTLFLPTAEILPDGIQGNLINLLIWNTWMFIVFIAYESLLIHKFGATLGKKMFGLRVRSVDHRNPTMKESLRRATSFFTNGLGLLLFFPYVQLVTAWYVHRNWKVRNSTNWDLASRTFVEQKSVSQGRLSIVIPIAAILITSLFIGQMAMKQARKNEALREQVSQ